MSSTSAANAAADVYSFALMRFCKGRKEDAANRKGSYERISYRKLGVSESPCNSMDIASSEGVA